MTEPAPTPPPDRAATDYDAVVIGGAFSGAVTATLLKRWVPEARLLIVERAAAFDRKVGEATVEISALMLHRVLGLHDLLAREHLPKHGLRYWFSDGADTPLAEMSEVGPSEIPSLPAFQLDRSKIDESLLAHAAEAGVEVARPMAVADLELGWPESRLTLAPVGGDGKQVRDPAAGRTVTARWVIDASGRQAFIARRLGLLKRTEEHPTAAFWGRWRGIGDLDGVALRGGDPRQPAMPPLPASRRLATNHFCGRGWWCWMIPLGGGETSVGLVIDKRMFAWPDEGGANEGAAIERYRAFMAAQPGLRELTAGAELDEDDYRSYAHLAYYSERYAEVGWAAVGDAAGFMDPFYSPGLDHASMSGYATARLIEEELSGRLAGDALAAAVTEHDERFRRSYQRWLGALFLDKYELFGDAELTAASFLLDTGTYYLGIVRSRYLDIEELRLPVFGRQHPGEVGAYRFVRFYNQRLVTLARRRQRLGIYGRKNRGWRLLVKSPGLAWRSIFRMIGTGMRVWLGAELSTAWARIKPGGRRAAAEEVTARV